MPRISRFSARRRRQAECAVVRARCFSSGIRVGCVLPYFGGDESPMRRKRMLCGNCINLYLLLCSRVNESRSGLSAALRGRTVATMTLKPPYNMLRWMAMHLIDSVVSSRRVICSRAYYICTQLVASYCLLHRFFRWTKGKTFSGLEG